jgi:NADP-dependent 3-hydroxy acid dehydrogenase YdfG
MALLWITGASSGIGAGLATRIANEGQTVATSARRATELEKLASEARDLPGRIVPLPLDVTDRAAVHRAARALFDAEGIPDTVILNAGTYIPLDLDALDAEAFGQQVGVNLMGTVNVLEAVLPPMLERGHGRVVIVASVAGYRGLPSAAAYGATKAALINLAEAMRVELAPRGIVVQLINPGFVDTPLTRRNRFKMPFLMSLDAAVDRMARALKSNRFEVSFPRRFTWQLKLLRCLPYTLYFPIVRRRTGVRSSKSRQ